MLVNVNLKGVSLRISSSSSNIYFLVNQFKENIWFSLNWFTRKIISSINLCDSLTFLGNKLLRSLSSNKVAAADLC